MPLVAIWAIWLKTPPYSVNRDPVEEPCYPEHQWKEQNDGQRNTIAAL